MKKHYGLLALLLPLAAMAGERGDYAQQWVLETTRDDAGVYRVELGPDIYRQARDPALRDIEVFNAKGQSLPAALQTEKAPSAAPPVRADVPWFVLPATVAGKAGDDITLVAERDEDGSVRRLQAQVSGGGRAAGVSPGWLVDTSRLREPVRALHLQWADDAAPFEQSLRVEGSDDLRRWDVLETRAPWLDLTRHGYRLREGRVATDGSRHRYLRVVPSQPETAPALLGVQAELGTPVADPEWRWESLQGQRVTEQGREYLDFEMDGRFPVLRVDVDTGGNDTRQWTVQSREAVDAPWRPRAGPWIGYQLQSAGRVERSPAQALAGAVRDRYWRLSSATPLGAGEAPVLRLGYRPETLAFLAQGEPPYALAAGSARALRADSSLEPMLVALRNQRGQDWEPAMAGIGPAETLAGAAALEPVVERDWKTWLLWGLLVGGALLVAGFAFSLLRKPAPPQAD